MSAVDAFAARVEAVTLNTDPEDGHMEEDKLLWDFLRALGEGSLTEKEARRVARLMVRGIGDVPRRRWYA